MLKKYRSSLAIFLLLVGVLAQNPGTQNLQSDVPAASPTASLAASPQANKDIADNRDDAATATLNQVPQDEGTRASTSIAKIEATPVITSVAELEGTHALNNAANTEATSVTSQSVGESTYTNLNLAKQEVAVSSSKVPSDEKAEKAVAEIESSGGLRSLCRQMYRVSLM